MGNDLKMNKLCRQPVAVTAKAHAYWGGLFSLWALLALLLLFSLQAVATETEMNKYCPVTTTELAEKQFSLEYNGQQIYFCCNKCKKEFLANPDVYLANLTLEVQSSEASEHVDVGEDHQHELEEAAGESHDYEHNQDNTVSTVALTNQEEVESHDHAGSEMHDHATGHGDTSSLVTILGKFHPLLTHFPIALILAGLLFSCLAVLRKAELLQTVSVYCLYVAALSAIATVLLGLAAGAGADYPSFLQSYLSSHRLLGISTGVMTLVTAYLGYRQQRVRSIATVRTYRAVLFVNSILVGVTGHFGALLVFGPDYFNF
jgi:uncharacterized membrane protein/YHS domain-containing protein